MATNPNYQERGIHLGEETVQSEETTKHPIFTGVKISLEGGKLNLQGPTIRRDVLDRAQQELIANGRWVAGGILALGVLKSLHII